MRSPLLGGLSVLAAALGAVLCTVPAEAASPATAGDGAPAVVVTRSPGTPSIEIASSPLREGDRVEIELPAGVLSEDDLVAGWRPAARAPEEAVQLWTTTAHAGRRVALRLDLGGLVDGDRGRVSVYRTDPVSGDELQRHWWIAGGSDGGPVIIPAGAARVSSGARLTFAGGGSQRWADLERDGAGRVLIRRSDPRYTAAVGSAEIVEPYLRAASIAAGTAIGSETGTNTANTEFTNKPCTGPYFGSLINITTAPASTTIVAMDLAYRVYHSVDVARFKSALFRWDGFSSSNPYGVYNGTSSGTNWLDQSQTGINDYNGLPVNYQYILGNCNVVAGEYAYLDEWTITLYYGSGPSIDLAADSMNLDFGTVAVGGQIGYYYQASVGGSGAVGSSFTTGLYLSADATVTTGDRLLDSVTESSTLAAGDSYPASPFARLVNVPADVVPGSYRIGIITDSTGLISESNEGNNTVSLPITIVAGSSKPNLVASDCSVSPDHADAGDTVTLSSRGRNTGATGAAYFSWAEFLSTDATYEFASDTNLAGLDVLGGWPAGYDSAVTSSTHTLDASLADGVYYIGFAVDPGNQVPETNENDNFCVAMLTVGSGGGGGSSGVTHWLIAGAASTQGFNLSNWKTQLSIVNPDTTSHTANVYYVAKGQSWPGVLLSGPISLAPAHSKFLDDPLAGLRPTSGTIYVVTDSPGPVVTSRTFNEKGGGGTFGQGIAAEPIGSTCASEYILPMVHSAPDGFHTNLGLVQADSGQYTAEVTVYSSSGTVLASKSYTRTAAFDQIADLFGDMGIGSTTVHGGWIRVRLTAGCPAHWTTYASVVDDLTGDPTYVTPVKR